jgi:hypothetical protein
MMIIASTAFKPFGNGVEKGGIGHKLAFDRVGKMGAAEKDAYR